MRAYEFRRYLLRRDFNEVDIKNHIENVRKVEKALERTAESLSSIEAADSQLTWKTLPWKKKELLDSLALYFAFKTAYVRPAFTKVTLNCKECPECGERTPLGSTYCRKCGAAIGATQFKQINEIYDSVEDKWNNHRQLMIGGIAIVAALILYIAFFFITAFPVPDIVGKDPITARNMLLEKGVKEEAIIIECSYDELTIEDAEKGEYEVTLQEPKAGIKIHRSNEVTIRCKDLYKERSTEIRSCRFKEVAEAEDIAKEYNYMYELKKLDENVSDREKLYVFRVIDQDDDNRTVTYELDSENNISEWITGIANNYVGKSIAVVDDLEEEIGCSVFGINNDKEEMPYFLSSDRENYQITGVEGFNIKYKELSLNVDTKEHLEKLKTIAGLKDKIPYKGMSEEFIDDTGAGKHTDKEDSDDEEHPATRYVWKSTDEKYDVLIVVCKEGKVTKVKKENEEVFWKGELPDCSVDGDAVYAEIEREEAEREAKEEAEAEAEAAKLEAEAEEYAAAARDRMSVFVTRSGTYHIDGCGDLNKANSYWETTYGNAKNTYHPCLHCNPDTYCDRAYSGYKSEYIRKGGKL